MKSADPTAGDRRSDLGVRARYGPRRAVSVVRFSLLGWLERYGLLLLIAAVALFFASWSKTSATYLATANIQTTVANQTVLGVAAIAVVIPLVCSRFDLSVGAILGVSAVAASAAMSSHGWALAPAAVLGVSMGGALGAFNGFIVTRLHIDSLIGTLGVATLLSGLISWYTEGSSIVTGVSKDLVSFGTENTFGIPNTVFALAAVALVTWYLLEHTPLGRYLLAIGSNEQGARLVGTHVDRLIFLSFVLSGVLASIAGILLVARTGGATPQGGPAFMLPAFAAAFLGTAAIRPGRFNVWGTVVAIFFLASITSGLNLAGAQSYVTDTVNGSALLVGVGLTAYLTRRRRAGKAPAASEALPANASPQEVQPATTHHRIPADANANAQEAEHDRR